MLDLRWQMVVCCDCGKRYRCTPDSDYFHDRELPVGACTATSGRCWECHLKAHGLPPQPEPRMGDPEFRHPFHTGGE
jgi:hypothetical protein